MAETKAPPKKSSGGMMSKKVGGVPVPILVVGGVVVAVLVYRKLKGSTSSTTSTGTTAAGDTTGTTGSGSGDQGTGYSGGGYSGDGSGGGNGGFSSLLAQIAALQSTQASQMATITQQANSKEAQIKALQNKLNSIKGTGSKATSKTYETKTGGHYEASGAPAPVSTKPTAQAISLGDLKSTGITQKASTPSPAKAPEKTATKPNTESGKIKSEKV